MSVGDWVIPAALTVLRPGPMATIQDLGRPDRRSLGVPVAGAFDRASHELANALVGNGPEAATIELTLFGGAFRAEIPLAVALAGAPMPILVRRAGGPDWRALPPVAFPLLPGDVLELGGASSGARAYLAVRGGWQTPLVLDSRSAEEPLRAGITLPAMPGTSPVLRPGPGLVGPFDPEAPVRLIEGPDAGLLADREGLHRAFRVSEASDRMGLRLDGPPVAVVAPPDRPSVPVAPGAIQVAGGCPIILGVACGTMGGYPHVAHVATVDLGRVAQARPGQEIRFRTISLAEARRLDRLDRARLRALRLRVATLAAAWGRDRAIAVPGRLA